MSRNLIATDLKSYVVLYVTEYHKELIRKDEYIAKLEKKIKYYEERCECNEWKNWCDICENERCSACEIECNQCNSLLCSRCADIICDSCDELIGCCGEKCSNKECYYKHGRYHKKCLQKSYCCNELVCEYCLTDSVIQCKICVKSANGTYCVNCEETPLICKNCNNNCYCEVYFPNNWEWFKCDNCNIQIFACKECIDIDMVFCTNCLYIIDNYSDYYDTSTVYIGWRIEPQSWLKNEDVERESILWEEMNIQMRLDKCEVSSDRNKIYKIWGKACKYENCTFCEYNEESQEACDIRRARETKWCEVCDRYACEEHSVTCECCDLTVCMECDEFGDGCQENDNS